jgi:hypothetical protein
MNKTLLVYSLIFLLSSCNFQKKNPKLTLSEKEKVIFETHSIFDTTIISKKLSDCIITYMKDTSISKYSNSINLLCVSFYNLNNDTVMSLQGFTDKPTIIPKLSGEEHLFQGWLYFNHLPVLISDNETLLGTKFYKPDMLLPDTVTIHNLIDDQYSLPRWIYKVESGKKLALQKKNPRYKIYL